MMEVVNGIPCFNCTDVDRAKKNGGEDPKAEKAAGLGHTSAAAKSELDKLSARGRVDVSQKSREALNENQPLAFGERGRAFNILA
jgi:hypothetical protein